MRNVPKAEAWLAILAPKKTDNCVAHWPLVFGFGSTGVTSQRYGMSGSIYHLITTVS